VAQRRYDVLVLAGEASGTTRLSGKLATIDCAQEWSGIRDVTAYPLSQKYSNWVSGSVFTALHGMQTARVY